MSDRTVLVLKMTGCGCMVGVVVRQGELLTLAGRRRELVYETETSFSIHEREFIVPDLAHPDRPQDVGCRHSAGSLLDLGDLLRRAESATKRREMYLVGPSGFGTVAGTK